MLIQKTQAIEIISLLVKANVNLVERIYVGNENKRIPRAKYYQVVEKYRNKILADIKHDKFESYLPYFPVLSLFANKQTENEVPNDFSISLESHVAFGALKPVEKENFFATKELGPHILWDLSVNAAGESGIVLKHFRKFYDLIKEDKQILTLIENIGGTNQIRSTNKMNYVEEERFNITIPSEYSAITQSDDLRNIFYLDLINLKDEDLEIIFYKKVVDKNLLTYQLGKKVFEQIPQTLVASDKQHFKGSIIVAIDTSGSMRGAAEIISKYIALLVVEVCLPIQRCVTLMSYSTDHFSYTINYYDSIQLIHTKVEEFLSQSFYGGTDVKSPLDAILTKINSLEEFYYADVLFISDFIFKDYDLFQHSAFANFKRKGCKIIGLEINTQNVKQRKLPSFVDDHYIFFFNWQNAKTHSSNFLKEFSNHFLNPIDDSNPNNNFNEKNEKLKQSALFFAFLRKIK